MPATRANAPAIVVFTMTTVFVPMPWRRAIAVASTVASVNDAKRASKLAVGALVLTSRIPPRASPSSTSAPSKCSSSTTTWSGRYTLLRFVTGASSTRVYARTGAPDRSPA